MRAKQVMTREVIVIPKTTSQGEAYALMKAHSIRHLPVTHGLHLLGMISDRDLLRAGRMTEDELTFEAEPVEGIMSTGLITASSTSTVSDLAGLMIDHRIDSIPIVGLTGELIGLVTSSDLLELLRDDDYATKIIPFDFLVRQSGAAASA